MRSMSKAPITARHHGLDQVEAVGDRAGDHLVLELGLDRASVSLRRSTLLPLAPTGVSVGQGLRGHAAVDAGPVGDGGLQRGLEVDAGRAEARGVDVRDVVGDDTLTQGETVEGGVQDARDRIGREGHGGLQAGWGACRSIGGGRAVLAQ